MTLKKFKIWLIDNNHTQKSLAEALNITPHTITNYAKKERFPRVFCLALVGLEKRLEKELD